MDADKLIYELASMVHNKLHNYIIPGLTSMLVGGGEHGKVRLFQMTREARDWVTPHSHRFNFTSLVLAGRVHNTLFERPLDAQRDTRSDEWCLSTIDQVYGTRSDEWCLSTIDQVCGTDGLRKYTHTRETEPSRWLQVTRTYETGETYSMNHSEIHSIVFERGSVVLFFEGPQVTPTSVMLEPWVNGKIIPTFRTEPWMFEKDVP